MRKLTRLAILACALAIPAAAWATPSAQNGRLVFDHWCAPCHARSAPPRLLPGSEALRIKYHGKLTPFLEDRTDLKPDFVKLIVRHGVKAMPPTRKTEITDRELDDLAAYLANTAP